MTGFSSTNHKSSTERQWWINLGELRKYCEKYGATPRESRSKDRTDEEVALGKWLNAQRALARSGGLESDQSDALKGALEYVWPRGRKFAIKSRISNPVDPNPLVQARVTWDTFADLLADFLNTRGHLPDAEAGFSEYRLAIWLESQRRRLRAGTLPTKRVMQLADLLSGSRSELPAVAEVDVADGVSAFGP